MSVLLNRIKHLRSATPQVQEQGILFIIEQNAPAFIDANLEQLRKGEDSQGNKLRSYSSAQYAAFKKTLNPLGVTDLKLTGDFWDGFFLDASSDPVVLWSHDEKTQMLVDDYGKNIFGITASGLNEIAKGYLLEDVRAFYRDILGI